MIHAAADKAREFGDKKLFDEIAEIAEISMDCAMIVMQKYKKRRAERRAIRKATPPATPCSRKDRE